MFRIEQTDEFSEWLSDKRTQKRDIARAITLAESDEE